MASRLTPFGVVLKWILVPVSLGAIGYFLVGPRVDGNVAKEIQKKVSEVRGGALNPDESDPENPEGDEEVPKSRFTPPELDVTVSALNTRPTTTRKKRRRRTQTPTSTAPSSPSVAPPPADGGSSDPG